MNRTQVFFSLLSFVLLFSSNHSLAQNLEQATIETRSIENPDDPYSTRYELLGGKYEGMPIDIERFRYAMIVEENDEKIVFANFRHQNKYWLATLKKSAKVELGYVHIVNFATPVPNVTAAHTQYRIIFAEGSELELESQVTDEKTKVNDFVVSAEAARPENVPYSFLVGFDKNYARTIRILSGWQRAEESTENATEQWEVKFSSDEFVQMAINSIHESNQEKFNVYYGTLFPNCTTDLFNSIDKILKDRGQRVEPFLTVFSNDPIAGPTRQALKERGILGERGPNLRDEILDGATAYIPRQIEQQIGFFPEDLMANLSFVAHVPGKTQDQVLNSPLYKTAEESLVEGLTEFAQYLFIIKSLGNTEARDVLKQGLAKAQKVLEKVVTDLDAEIPGGMDQKVLLYLSPFDGRGKKDLSPILTGNLPARLPLKIYYAETDDVLQVRQAPGLIREAFVAEAQRKNLELPSFFVNNLVLQLHLKKGESKVTLQVLGSLGELKKTLNKKEGKVLLRTIHARRDSLSDQVGGLLSAKVEYQVGQKEASDIFVEFGRNLGAKPNPFNPSMVNMEINTKNKDYGLFQMQEGYDGETHARAQYVPYFEGEEHYSPFKVDIDFPIFSINLDAETLTIQGFDVQVYKSGWFLIENESVKTQFEEAINKMIADAKAKGTSFLGELLNSN